MPLKQQELKHTNQIFKQTVIAGFIAALALIFIYVSLGYIGNHRNKSKYDYISNG